MAILNQDRWIQSVSEHEDVMEALRNRDEDAAKTVWETHLLNTGLSVKSALTAQAGA